MLFDGLVCHDNCYGGYEAYCWYYCKNQASGGKWIISDSIVDTVGVFIYCYIDEVDEFFEVGFGTYGVGSVWFKRGWTA